MPATATEIETKTCFICRTQKDREFAGDAGGLLRWLGVTLYFFHRFRLAARLAVVTVAILLAYKIAVIGV